MNSAIHTSPRWDVARETRLELVREGEIERVAGHSFPQTVQGVWAAHRNHPEHPENRARR